jgi:hypothetical protein
MFCAHDYNKIYGLRNNGVFKNKQISVGAILNPSHLNNFKITLTFALTLQHQREFVFQSYEKISFLYQCQNVSLHDTFYIL